MKCIVIFVIAKLSFAFEKNCTANTILNNKIKSCQRNNVSCNLLIYTNEFNKYSVSLTIVQTKQEKSNELTSSEVPRSPHSPYTLLQAINKKNTTYIYLNQCRTSCKSSINDLSLSNCYKNCFIVAYNCLSPSSFPSKKPTFAPTIRSKRNNPSVYGIVIACIIVVWLGLIVTKYACFHTSYNYKNKVHVTTFTNV
jgi:hypothetical protein